MSRLRRAAIIALGVHLIAGAAMALILSHGLETNPDFIARLNFIVHHDVIWAFAWLTWTAAAVAILYFYDCYASAHQLGMFAVLLTAAAIVADISAQTIEIAIIPSIAQRILHSEAGWDRFVLLHRMVVLLSGYVANSLYSLSAILLSWGTRHAYPRRVWGLGLLVGAFGFALSTAAILDAPGGLLLSNILLVPTLLVWLLLVARESRS